METVFRLGVRLGVVLGLCATAACVNPAPEPDPASAGGGEASYSSEQKRGELRVTFPSGGMARGVNQLVFKASPTWRGATAEVSVASVTALMPSHGHEAEPKALVPIGPDEYRADGLDLSMPGHWVIEVTLRSGGEEDEVDIDVGVP